MSMTARTNVSVLDEVLFKNRVEGWKTMVSALTPDLRLLKVADNGWRTIFDGEELLL